MKGRGKESSRILVQIFQSARGRASEFDLHSPSPTPPSSTTLTSMSDDPNGVAWTVSVPAEDPVKEDKPEAKFPPKGDEELKAAAKAELKEGADELVRSLQALG